jgi:hypothetical protein
MNIIEYCLNFENLSRLEENRDFLLPSLHLNFQIEVIEMSLFYYFRVECFKIYLYLLFG